MSFTMATTLTLHLLAFALLLQSCEVWLVSRDPIFKSIWSYENIGGDLETGLPLPNKLVRRLFSSRGFRVLVIAQILSSGFALIAPWAGVFVALTIFQLLIGFRFRGSFNGGSDMMTFVALTGALVITLGADERTQRLGLLYIAIHAIYSYAKAGFVKLRDDDWRNGTPLPSFLSRSLFTDIRRLGVMLRFRPAFTCALTWSIMCFELTAVALPFFPRFVGIYFTFAVVFHYAVYRAFGLNRFFWIWLTAWPSIFYVTSLTSFG